MTESETPIDPESEEDEPVARKGPRVEIVGDPRRITERMLEALKPSISASENLRLSLEPALRNLRTIDVPKFDLRAFTTPTYEKLDIKLPKPLKPVVRADIAEVTAAVNAQTHAIVALRDGLEAWAQRADARAAWNVRLAALIAVLGAATLLEIVLR